MCQWGCAKGVTTMSFAKNATLVRLVWRMPCKSSKNHHLPRKVVNVTNVGNQLMNLMRKRSKKEIYASRKRWMILFPPALGFSEPVRTRQNPSPGVWLWIFLTSSHACLSFRGFLVGNRLPRSWLTPGDPWWPLIHPAFWEVLLGQALLGMTNNDE